jgi:hypothetical protein
LENSVSTMPGSMAMTRTEHWCRKRVSLRKRVYKKSKTLKKKCDQAGKRTWGVVQLDAECSHNRIHLEI